MAASKSWVSLVLISAMPDCYHSDLCYDYLLPTSTCLPTCEHADSCIYCRARDMKCIRVSARLRIDGVEVQLKRRL